MSKRQSLPVLEKKIKETEKKLATAKQRYDRLGQQLSELNKQRNLLQAEMIVEALNKSGKTMRELMTFLNLNFHKAYPIF